MNDLKIILRIIVHLNGYIDVPFEGWSKVKMMQARWLHSLILFKSDILSFFDYNIEQILKMHRS